jgi:hypothetical protein
VLSAVKQTKTNLSDSGYTYPTSWEPQPYIIFRPLQTRPPKHPVDSTDVWATRCPNIGQQEWRSVNDSHGRTSWYTNAAKRWRTCVKTAHVVYRYYYRSLNKLEIYLLTWDTLELSNHHVACLTAVWFITLIRNKRFGRLIYQTAFWSEGWRR